MNLIAILASTCPPPLSLVYLNLSDSLSPLVDGIDIRIDIARRKGSRRMQVIAIIAVKTAQRNAWNFSKNARALTPSIRINLVEVIGCFFF